MSADKSNKLVLNTKPTCSCCGTDTEIRFALYVKPHYKFLVCPLCDKIVKPPEKEVSNG